MLLLANSHERNVDGQPVQPGGKARFAAKSLNLAEQLQEGVLCQVFGFMGLLTIRRQRLYTRRLCNP